MPAEISLWVCCLGSLLGLKLVTECVGSGALGKDSDVGQCHMLPVVDPGHLSGGISDPQFVAASSGSGCTQEGPSCASRLTLTGTRPRIVQQKTQSTRDLALPASPCWLPVRLSWKEPLAELLSRV